MLGEIPLLDGFENLWLLGLCLQEHLLTPVDEGRTVSRDGRVTRINSHEDKALATF